MKRNVTKSSIYLVLVLIMFLALTGACQPTQKQDPILQITLTQTQTLTPTSTTALPTPTTISTPIPKPSATPTPLPTASMRVNLMAVGDIMLGRTIADMILSDGADKPFEHVASILNRADITIGNLESPISTRGEPEGKTYVFRAPKEAAAALGMAGFDMVNLANNHILDYGDDALFDTLQILDENDIAYSGAGIDEISARTPVILEQNGLRIAVLGYLDIPIWKYDYTQWQAAINKPGLAWGFRYDIVEDVKAAKSQTDVVIVMMHFGNEYEAVVSQAQIDTAHAAIDAGALLVIGSHPHLLQSVEAYQNGLIAYSLGNFVFDQFHEAANKTAILSIMFTSEGIENYELIPVLIGSDGRPALIP